MGTDLNNMANGAESRSAIYGLLAAVFREEPTEAFIKEMKGGALTEVFDELDIKLGDDFQSQSEGELAEKLAIEFTRLFYGPGTHISPHESVFTEVDGDTGGLWGARTVEVKKFIETTGLEYGDEFPGLPDHISAELEFLQKLTQWESDKWRKGDQQSADYCLDIQRQFFDNHLQCWASNFCNEVIKVAEQPFYSAMAELTKNFVEFERDFLAVDSG